MSGNPEPPPGNLEAMWPRLVAAIDSLEPRRRKAGLPLLTPAEYERMVHALAFGAGAPRPRWRGAAPGKEAEELERVRQQAARELAAVADQAGRLAATLDALHAGARSVFSREGLEHGKSILGALRTIAEHSSNNPPEIPDKPHLTTQKQLAYMAARVYLDATRQLPTVNTWEDRQPGFLDFLGGVLAARDLTGDLRSLAEWAIKTLSDYTNQDNEKWGTRK